MKKLCTLAGAICMFTVVLSVIYTIHARFFPVNVVFYSALLDVFLAATCCGIAVGTLKFFDVFSIFEKFQVMFIFLLIGYSLAISVPTVIDRSLSFYILEKLHQRGGGIREDAFADVFINEYMEEHRLIDVRLTEQKASGTIKIENGCVKLTPKGLFIANLSRAFRLNFLPKRRLLLNGYTDDLTDPFRNTNSSPSYACSNDQEP